MMVRYSFRMACDEFLPVALVAGRKRIADADGRLAKRQGRCLHPQVAR